MASSASVEDHANGLRCTLKSSYDTAPESHWPFTLLARYYCFPVRYLRSSICMGTSESPYCIAYAWQISRALDVPTLRRRIHGHIQDS